MRILRICFYEKNNYLKMNCFIKKNQKPTDNQILEIRHFHISFYFCRNLQLILSTFLQEIVLKRAADLAEALYSMPRNPNQLSLPPPRSPAMTNGSPMSSFNPPYSGQLAVSIQDTNGQWEEGRSCKTQNHNVSHFPPKTGIPDSI